MNDKQKTTLKTLLHSYGHSYYKAACYTQNYDAVDDRLMPFFVHMIDDTINQVADEYARYVCRRALYYDIKKQLWYDQYVEGGFTSDEIYAQFEADRKASQEVK